jgi:hypothetical protein
MGWELETPYPEKVSFPRQTRYKIVINTQRG